MKFGILTFHRANNYGAILQCYALKSVLQSLGHSVDVLDYRNDFIERKFKLFSLSEFLSCCNRFHSFAKYLIKIPSRYRRSKNFDNFLTNHFSLSEPFKIADSIPQEYDIYIIGSDQLWNDSLTGSFDSVFLGNFPHNSNSRIVGYAISSNVVSINNMGDDLLKNSISNFSKLSFREIGISALVKDRIGIKIPVVIDPTLLTNEQTWLPLVNQKYAGKNYILTYQIRGNAKEKSVLLKQAADLGRKINCEVINISYAKHTVYDFLSLFKYAKYVVTNSFHGTAFSIIFRKPLACIKLNDKNDIRYTNLLAQLNLEHLIYELGDSITPTTIEDGDLNRRIQTLQNESLDFLRTI